MRWKLLIIAPLLAAVLGAGVCTAVALLLLDPAGGHATYSWLAPASLVVPLAATAYATVFVYRHTARRRALQAAATALLALLLTLAALLLVSIFTSKRAARTPPRAADRENFLKRFRPSISNGPTRAQAKSNDECGMMSDELKTACPQFIIHHSAFIIPHFPSARSFPERA